jgi:deazaflavin-dependent oxidoreductase (nitroreductase family)
MTIEARLGTEQYCYLTTIGRNSGEPREIEIWFAARRNTLYLLSGNGPNSHWVMNVFKNPSVSVRLDDEQFTGVARVLEPGEEEQSIRPLLAAKYEDWHAGKPLSAWARGALPVAIDITATGAV